MIDGDLTSYLQTASGLIALLPATKIFLGQAPNTVSMPWLVIEIFTGPRNKIAATKTEVTNTVRISVGVGPSDKVKGRNIAEQVLRYMENFRGLMGATSDMHVTCGSVGFTTGTGGTFNYSFNALIKYVEVYREPA